MERGERREEEEEKERKGEEEEKAEGFPPFWFIYSVAVLPNLGSGDWFFLGIASYVLECTVTRWLFPSPSPSCIKH
jgi:hypothetical protein